MSPSHCTQCQHVVKGNIRICPMCGGGMKQEVENLQCKCPRCQIDLEIHQFNHHQQDQCSKCEGLWLEPDNFNCLSQVQP